MTKAIMNIDDLGNIFFDCINHADDHDACTIVSTLCNVLVEACFREDKEPTIYNKGHVRIDISNADEKTIAVFRTVEKVMLQAADQHPEHIQIY